MAELHCGINNFTRPFSFLSIYNFFLVKLVGWQISDQYFLLACISDSTTMDIWQINSYTYRQKINIDGKRDPFQSLLFQFKAYYNFKRIVLPPFRYARKKTQQKPFSLVSYLIHTCTSGYIRANISWIFRFFFMYIYIYVTIQCALMLQHVMVQHVACAFNTTVGNGNLPICLASIAC